MLTQMKLLPIHAEQHVRGKVFSLFERTRRSRSQQSSRNPTPEHHQEGLRKYVPPRIGIQRPRQHSMLNARTEMALELPAPEMDRRHMNATGSSKRGSLKKGSYMPRKALEKQVLESYLDTVFRKMSMIRTDESRGITLQRRARTRSTMRSTMGVL
jgi:hypothetical protein